MQYREHEALVQRIFVSAPPPPHRPGRTEFPDMDFGDDDDGPMNAGMSGMQMADPTPARRGGSL